MEPDDELAQTLSEFFALEAWPQRAMLVVDAAGQTIHVVVPSDPCQCKPRPDAQRFKASDTDCKDPLKADAAVADFGEMDEAEVDALSPADLNNIACALLWHPDSSPADAGTAYELLKQAYAAAEDDALRQAIAENFKLFQPIEPGFAPSLAAFERTVYGEGRTMASVAPLMVREFVRGDT